VGRAFSRGCLFVCLFVCALKGKRLELSTPNLVDIYSIVVVQHALTQRSKGQGHTVTKTVTVAWLLMTRAATAVYLLLLAWVCMSIRLSMFSSLLLIITGMLHVSVRRMAEQLTSGQLVASWGNSVTDSRYLPARVKLISCLRYRKYSAHYQTIRWSSSTPTDASVDSK